MRAEVISIGDELTSGQRLDTNSQWLSERLGELGVTVMFHTTVADDLAANVLVFRQACERADVIVASGGLGPTADDLTRQALAEMAGIELVQDDAALAHIRALFARRGREMPPNNLVQALFPRGSRVIPNPHGSAPGIDLEVSRAGQSSARIFALPGVPAEMKEMWLATVGPAIAEHGGTKKTIRHHRIKCFGVGESDLELMLPDLIRRGRTPSVGITASQATITLRITAEGETPEAALAAMAPTIATIRECAGELIYGEEEDELQHAVLRILKKRGQTLAVAECGTGGMLMHWLSECAEAEGTFLGGIVASDAAAFAAMANGCREQFGADYALAVGPFPSMETTAEQAGNVHFSLAGPAGVATKSATFFGHPEILKPRAAKQALNFLRLHLLRESSI